MSFNPLSRKLLLILIAISIAFPTLYLVAFTDRRSSYDREEEVVKPNHLTLTAELRDQDEEGNTTYLVTAYIKNSAEEIVLDTPFQVFFSIISGPQEVTIQGENPQVTAEGKTEISLFTSAKQGTIIVQATSKGLKKAVTRIFLTPLGDIDRDGFPDAVELTTAEDRYNFTEWFITIAESQYYNKNRDWSEKYQDCSGLIRYAYREALSLHTNEWLDKFYFSFSIAIPDVKKYNYPEVPILGRRLFRIARGPFKPSDMREELFRSEVSASVLKNYNTVFLGRRDEDAERGSLLFFYHPSEPDLPYHAMIFAGDDNGIVEKDNDDWIVYHTGPIDDTKGTVKKVRREVLKKHPDKTWRPVSTNPNFLGYYRFKIID